MKTEKVFLIISVIVLNLMCKKEVTPKSFTSTSQDADSILFSGYTWYIKNSESLIGPSPNYWQTRNAWVDQNGYLHLKITQDKKENRWFCAEVYSKDLFSFGTFQ